MLLSSSWSLAEERVEWTWIPSWVLTRNWRSAK